VQHVSHFSHLGLIAFDLFLLLGRFDYCPGLFPVTGTTVTGHSTPGSTVGNPVVNKSIVKIGIRDVIHNFIFALIEKWDTRGILCSEYTVH